MAGTRIATVARQRGADAAQNAAEAEEPHPYIDRFGVRHSAAVLKNWSPAAIKALGIRRADEKGAVGGA